VATQKCTLPRVARTCLVFLGLSQLASAQAVLRDWSGVSGPVSKDDDFGSRVACIGDVDGDGISDAVVAAEYEDASYNTEVGAAYVISSASGTVLQHQLGELQRQLFSFDVCCPGDLDGDGVGDLLVGAPDGVFTTTEGRVYAYSGATGASLFRLDGPSIGSMFGAIIGELGDVDADGVVDFGVSCNQTGPGTVYIYSGSTLTPLYTFNGGPQLAHMANVRGLGDLDGDGHADFALGALGGGPNNEGIIMVVSGATGATSYTIQGEAYGSAFGSEIASIGDADGDGAPDFAISSPYLTTNVYSEGRVYLYSGATGGFMYQFDGTLQNEKFGRLPKNGSADFNRDGFADIAIGSVAANTVYVYSGRTGTWLYDVRGRVESGNAEALGCSLSPIGDVNGDGFDDLLIGAAGNSRNYSWAGRAYVYGGNDLFLQSRKSAYRANDIAKISLRGGAPYSPACIALIDLNGTATFLPIAIGSLDFDGGFSVSGTVPSGLAGISLTFMGYAIKAGGVGVADSIPETVTFK